MNDEIKLLKHLVKYNLDINKPTKSLKSNLVISFKNRELF